jgi:hypothetical protein
MTLHAVERLLHELNRDPVRAGRFREDAAAELEGRDFTVEERKMLAERDVLGLYRHGVHPLLLAPASRFFGLDQEAFRAALAPALGERVR